MVMTVVVFGEAAIGLFDMTEESAKTRPVDRSMGRVPVLDVVLGVNRNQFLRLNTEVSSVKSLVSLSCSRTGAKSCACSSQPEPILRREEHVRPGE